MSVVGGDAGRLMYDGFVSYSHAADGLLAPRLQAGLQRFAKPWWQRRALRMFRDESSLSANPHLWSSITEALDDSEWFVLLLSPDAAVSPWVNQEIEYWKAHKDSSRILPVLTDGSFDWDGDVVGDAVPDQLRGVFVEEPRWVDLRFAKDEEQLDLKDPRFADAVADIASALRGVPKDELASEEVKQHRRTVRTAWGAAALVGVLALAAVVFGIQSANNARLAEAEAVRANEAADRAEQNAEEAQQQREIAKDNEERALREAALSEARRLVANSINAVDQDPELAILLAMYANAVSPKDDQVLAAEINSALFDALDANRLVKRFPIEQGQRDRAVLSPDGQTIYYASAADQSVSAVDVNSDSVLWTYPVDQWRGFDQVKVSPDGFQVVIGVTGRQGSDVEPARLIVLDPGEGSVIAERVPGECYSMQGWGSGFSPDGRYYVATSGGTECRVDGDDDWAVVYETAGWTVVSSVPVKPANPPVASFAPFPMASFDGLFFNSDSTIVLLTGFYAETELRTFPDLDPVERFGASLMAAFSANGDHLVLQPIDRFGLSDTYPLVIRVADGEVVTELIPAGLSPDDSTTPEDAVRFMRRGNPVSFSPDGDKVALSWYGQDYVFLLDDDRQISLGATGSTLEHSWSASGSLLLTVGEAGWMHLWQVGPSSPFTLQSGGLGPGELLDFALGRVTRGFTEGECLTYRIDPCPSLEEIRGG